LTTFKKHNPDNAVHIPGYVPKFTPGYIHKDEDQALLDLMMFLSDKEVNNTEDIRTIEKPGSDFWTPTPTSKIR
jgi:TFIIF-interacting CTD phosphatase-like protein